MSLDSLRLLYLDQPNEVSIETLSRCNAACSFCPYPTLERIGTQMPDEMIDRLIDEMSGWQLPFAFTPFKVNEPLLDKRLFDILSKVNERVPLAKIRIFTNGAPLTMRKAEELNSIDNLELWVSVHEPDAGTYKSVLGIDQRHVVANLDALHKTDFRHPVHILRVGTDGAEEFRDWVWDRWPEFTPVVVWKSSWLGYTSPDRPVVPDTACSRWFELSIMSTGIVSLCCMDGEGKFPIGDVTKQTMLEVYNSPAWRERRELMLSRRSVPVCESCSY